MTVANIPGVREGIEDGIQWKILVSPIGNAVNGYAKVPASHPWFGKNYDDLDVEAPGGLTFSDSAGWIGFDTAHYGDYWPTDELERVGGKRSKYEVPERFSDHRWTVEEIVTATKALARQVAEAAA